MRQLPGAGTQYLDHIRASQCSNVNAGQQHSQFRAWRQLGQTLRNQLPHRHNRVL